MSFPMDEAKSLAHVSRRTEQKEQLLILYQVIVVHEAKGIGVNPGGVGGCNPPDFGQEGRRGLQGGRGRVVKY